MDLSLYMYMKDIYTDMDIDIYLALHELEELTKPKLESAIMLYEFVLLQP